ncbi:unnamed protein product [Dibothriocephalus latus]|uniref:Nop domain-containing protein n=1 Tax=Dibothriocephalus latus TaxID=60516 RepID=A0A3P6UUI1_DIBLA|nr:unnamed protein product [Dibothriocephalus latus]
MSCSLLAATDTIEGKISKKLKRLLKKLYVKEIHDDVLAVADKKLSQEINAKMNVTTVSNSSVQNLMRAIRTHMSSLIPSIDEPDIMRMRLGLAHSLDRYKLKCNPDKIDTMIVQAIGLLDELDKESNNYVMRCKEMYGWHFPELSKIVTESMAYIQVVRRIGRMIAVAPNLTALVGEILGARLIARAGTLINLAKHPSSTVQILGAEKALFRALKTRHNTPKYGLLYHASLDADNEMGIRARAYLENRLRQLEAGTFNPRISKKRPFPSGTPDGPPAKSKRKSEADA